MTYRVGVRTAGGRRARQRVFGVELKNGASTTACPATSSRVRRARAFHRADGPCKTSSSISEIGTDPTG